MSDGKRHETTRELLIAAALEAGWSMAKGVLNFLRKATGTAQPANALERTVPVGPPQPERLHDRNEDCEKAIARRRREQWGTLFVLCASLIGIASGGAFIYLYWTNASTPLLGGTLALCLGGLGFSLVVWAHMLMRHTEAIGPREPMPSSADERQLTFDNFTLIKQDVKRRTLLTWVGLGFAGFFATAFVSMFRALGAPPGASLYDRIWKSGQRLMTLDGKPVSVDALQPGGMMLVFPEDSIGDERAQTILVRVKEQFVQMPEERADWAPMGYLAYSRICTHAGCPVALFQKQTHQLVCPCHQSSFNVLKGAVPTGGPASRALPQLPLYADSDGTLRAGGGFSTPPGPGFWGTPS